MLTVTKVLWVASVVAQCALLVRLFSAGLVRRAFPFFTGFIAWGVVSGLALIWIPFRSNAYGHAWLLSEPLFALLGFATLWECYRRAVDKHPTGDRFFVFAIAGALSLSLSVFTLSLELHSLHHISVYYWVILLDRIEASGTALFLGGLWIVFRQFPIARNTNTGVHWILLLVYGAANSIPFMLVAASSGNLVNLGNLLAQAFSLVLYILWTLRLTASGELDTPVDPNPEGEPQPPVTQQFSSLDPSGAAPPT